MIKCAFICHERQFTVVPQLTGPVKVIRHDPEGWQQINRMWKLYFTEWQGAQGMELQIPFIFDQYGYNPRTGTARNSVEPLIMRMELLASYDKRLGRPPIFTIDADGAVPHDVTRDPTKRWVCGTLDLDDTYVINRHNHRCRQTGTINAIEYVPSVVIQSKNLTPTKPVPHTYRIRKSDTLVKIAVYYYGDGSKWRDIAKLNHIHDPNHLKVGRVIKLPKQ